MVVLKIMIVSTQKTDVASADHVPDGRHRQAMWHLNQSPQVSGHPDGLYYYLAINNSVRSTSKSKNKGVSRI